MGGPDYHKCFWHYGATRAKIKCFEENALRVILASASRIASEHGKAIEPLVSFQRDFYLRVYVKVVMKKSVCQKSMEQTGLIYYGGDSGDYHVHRFGQKKEKDNNYSVNTLELHSIKSELDGRKWKPNGPVWLHSLNDHDFVRELLENLKILQAAEPKNEEEEAIYGDFKNIKITRNQEIHGFLSSIVAEEPLKNDPITWDMSGIFSELKGDNPRKIDIA